MINRNTWAKSNYKILSDDGTDIWILLPGGQKTVISSNDKWIFDIFSCFAIAGSNNKYVYAQRWIETEYSIIQERVYLHRVIVKPQGDECVDHKDRNPFNNRRNNLRICSKKENAANKSPRSNTGFKGVFKRERKYKLKKPFVSYIDSKARLGKRTYLGYFETAEEAALVYDLHAKQLWGEFAYLNFPNKIESAGE